MIGEKGSDLVQGKAFPALSAATAVGCVWNIDQPLSAV
jgi:hypothetical protein